MPVRRPHILLALALLLAGCLAALLLWPAAGPEVAPAIPGPPTEAPTIAVPTAAGPDGPVREDAPAPERATAKTVPNHPQGLRGRCVDADNRPLAGIEVHLVESAGNDPVNLMRLPPFGPLATTASREDGTFAVGLPSAQPRTYELYLVSPHHALTRLGGLRLLQQEWHDLGTIVLVVGASVRGRVTVAGRPDLPIAGAAIVLQYGTAFSDAALRALPATGPGFTTTTDQDGRYELTNAPGRGKVELCATAAGFARVSKPDIELRAAQTTDIDFSLPPGLSVQGTVQAANGTPIADARVEAWPTAAAGGPLLGTSDSRGQFAVHGLVVGTYRVRAQARGFERAEVATVTAGEQQLLLTLEPQVRLRVTVRDPSGKVVRQYRMQLRRVFPGVPDQLGAVPEVPEQRVRLDGLTDSAELADVPAGLFAVEVTADGFAKSLSPDVDTRGNAGAMLQVDVVLDQGRELRGRAVDENGGPLAGATITTMVDGTLPDSPFYLALGRSVPTRITATQATSLADGSFALRHLTAGTYQLQLEHPAACRTTVRGIQVGAADLQLPPTTLIAGAAVQGVATIGGKGGGQVRVILTTPSTTPGAAESLRLETIAAADGRFLLPRRVPPGTYELRAAAVGTTAPEEQIFHQLLQLRQSATTLTVLPGQRLVEHDVDLPER